MSPAESHRAAFASAGVTLAGRYALEEPIARGGMGTVFRAKDDVLARTVAVKLLHPELARDPSFVARFRGEAVAAARLTHPHIISIYDTGSDDAGEGPERHFIVMEHCDGGTLAAAIASRRLDITTCIGIGAAICDALSYAHRAGVVHRDIKPANVLFAGDGTLKVTDFGIAKAAFSSSEIATTGSILGTMTYISPEQAAGRDPDARSDIYSLAVVLYEMLVGRPPFEAESDIATALMHVRAEPPRPRSIRAHVPRALEDVLLKALAKQPNDRFSSADELKAALETSTVRRSSTPTRQRPPRSPAATPAQLEAHSDTRWVVPVLLLVVVSVLLAFAISRIGDEAEVDSPSAAGRDRAAGATIDVEEISDFDPHADQAEHSDEAPNAVDDDPSTAWTTESYSSSFDALAKPGVGLLLDLGSADEVAGARIVSTTPGMSFELRAGDEPGADESSFTRVAGVDDAGAVEELTFPSVRARYWLVWITKLPGEGGGRAGIAEVTLRGS